MESNSNSGGFTFSQDFSQQSFGGDSTWISDSQYFSGSQSQTFEGRPIPSEAKKSKYTLPKWSRALMNQAEENQRKKDLELAVKNLVEENKQIKATLQEFLKNYPKLIQEMVKESTNYILLLATNSYVLSSVVPKSFKNRNPGLKSLHKFIYHSARIKTFD